jgi:S-methylmethionine-dependent homocysteine/selenocysteine methylase
VNCIPAARTLAYLEHLAGIGVPFGAYANAGSPEEGIGWGAAGAEAAQVYLEFARSWVNAGATIVGGCCGTGPAHIEALVMYFRSE